MKGGDRRVNGGDVMTDADVRVTQGPKPRNVNGF